MVKPKSVKSLLLIIFQVAFIAFMAFTGKIFHNDVLFIILSLITAAPALWAILLLRSKLTITPEPATGAVLISSGPYKYIRHPMYTSALFLTLIWLIYDYSHLRLLVYILLVINMIVKMFYEENILFNTFEGYKDYITKTKRLIPFIF